MTTIKIPAPYLEDARKAAAIELILDAEGIRDGDLADRANNAEILERNVRVYQQLSAADADVTISAERDTLSSPLEHLLDQIVRVTAKRLNDAKDYGPVPMGTIMDIADELRWAAAEAVRIWPGADYRQAP